MRPLSAPTVAVAIRLMLCLYNSSSPSRYLAGRDSRCASVPVIGGSAMLAHDNAGNPDAKRCIDELLAALDSYIPDPIRAVGGNEVDRKA